MRSEPVKHANNPLFASPVFNNDLISGLTKREYIAIAAMQGLSANEGLKDSPAQVIAKLAVEQADALIAQLNDPRSVYES